MNSLKALIICAIAAVALACMSSCEKSGVQAAREDALTGQEILSLDDQKFLTNAEQSEIRQKALAETVLMKSVNPDVRAFATQIVSERSEDLARLRAIMKSKGFAQSSAAEEELQLEGLNRLHRLTGSALDREFISLITAEQQEGVQNFDLAAGMVADPDVRKYASEVLPRLRGDFDTALGLEKKLRPQSR